MDFVMTKRPTKKADLEALAGLSEVIAAGKGAVEKRREIFVRRTKAGDTTWDELASAANTSKMNVQQALKVAKRR